MKSWRFTGTNNPLELVELPDPVAGPGQVVVDVKAAGICHTDVGILTDPGWMSMLGQVPVTLGHEDAGVISQVGGGVTDFQVGDRVAICPTTSAGCPGSSFDGGFGPKIVIGTQALVPIPDEVDFVKGAAATDAGMTSYAAVVRRGGVKQGDKVGIIGLGGLGQIGARVAHLLGAEVYVAEIKEDVWPLAEELGAKDVRRSIKDFDDVRFDVIVDFAGFGDTTADAVDVIKLGGVVVLVGMGKLDVTFDAKSLIVNQCDLRGSNGGTPEDIKGVYELMRSGELDPVTTTVGFDEIPEAIERLERGEVKGRLVVAY
ncbi:zinc-binding dehydrogenase [Bifidobacterium eulemuris]|uniref:alcohol dehydrogenase n=1 Tax=Bifidobacterium eulemuris TaxID=1765219 RepID=A0A261G8G8_9BIFI|nr:zinc-binding dehydrogenase [Bifidobacterium eulemuris]OZG67296.1 alcohol dehydrogenase [Bifidobacterium eulemuris]QOL32879.1 zinc-binding dehydrogenase [Bifidobacterium eulemuris]